MLTARLARTLAPFALGVAALVGTAGCVGAEGSDESVEGDELEESDDALKVGRLPKGFGAAGVLFQESIGPNWPQTAVDPTGGASQSVFQKLKKAGVKTVRQTAALSFGRAYHTVKWDVAAAKREGVSLFVMVHLAHCQRPVAAGDVGNPNKDPGCHEIMTGTTNEGAWQFALKFKQLYDTANPNGEKNVKTWSINEPDLDMKLLADGPERAAAFYAAARTVLNDSGCPECTLVAGELSRYNTEWVGRYLKALKAYKQTPKYFGLHPYGDVGRASPTNWKTVTPTHTRKFSSAVRKAFPGAHIWLTEVGRMLHKKRSDKDFCVSSACGWASGMFARKRLPAEKGVTRVYWWDMATSQKDGWDSGLADHNGKYRAMYFGLMGYSQKTALAKSKGSDPKPWE